MLHEVIKKTYQSFSLKFHYGLNQSSHLYGQLEIHKHGINEVINALLKFGWIFKNLCLQKFHFNYGLSIKKQVLAPRH